MRDRMSSGALPFVDRTLRLLQPEGSSRAAQWRFAAVLAGCLLIHAAIVAAFWYRGNDQPEPLRAEEIPVEVVTEMPPPPPPLEEKKPEEKKPEPKKPEPPQPKYQQTLKPAFDAPRAPNEEKVEREVPEKETHAPQPQTQPVQQPPAEKAAQPDTPKLAALPAPERQEQTSQPPAPDEDKPQAEALSKAELQQKADKKKSNSDAAKTKKPMPPDQRSAMARQLAALSPTPDYSLGSMSKPAIVSGGTENTTYLSVLYGLIVRKMTNLNAVRSSAGTSVIFFALDDNGNILHVAIEKASGFPDIDAQTMEAVRRAAPFPPPPRDIPHRFFFSRDVEIGR